MSRISMPVHEASVRRIANEEDAGTEPGGRRAEVELGIHLQGRNADIYAIKVGANVEREEKRE